MKVVPMKKIYLDETDIASIISQHFCSQYPEATDVKVEAKGECDGYDETNVYAVVTIEME